MRYAIVIEKLESNYSYQVRWHRDCIVEDAIASC